MANKPLVIGITGGSGSGKTTVSRELVRRLTADGSVAILLQQIGRASCRERVYDVV